MWQSNSLSKFLQGKIKFLPYQNHSCMLGKQRTELVIVDNHFPLLRLIQGHLLLQKLKYHDPFLNALDRLRRNKAIVERFIGQHKIDVWLKTFFISAKPSAILDRQEEAQPTYQKHKTASNLENRKSWHKKHQEDLTPKIIDVSQPHSSVVCHHSNKVQQGHWPTHRC